MFDDINSLIYLAQQKSATKKIMLQLSSAEKIHLLPYESIYRLMPNSTVIQGNENYSSPYRSKCSFTQYISFLPLYGFLHERRVRTERGTGAVSSLMVAAIQDQMVVLKTDTKHYYSGINNNELSNFDFTLPYMSM